LAALVNAAVVIASVAITYLVIQFVFFRYLLPDMPLNLQPHLSDRANVFLQNSKSHPVAQNYVALIGDSYAQGVGDWLLSVGGQGNRPHHSADVIHDLAGRDVVSFGYAGSGSAEAMALHVTRALGGGACYAFPSIGEPKQFVIYFYEGNDIDDNNELIERAIQAHGPGLAAAVDAFLERNYGVASPWECYGHLGEMVLGMGRFLIRQQLRRQGFIDLPASRNRVVIAGTPTAVPELQLPSMPLSDQEIADGITVFDRSLAWLRRKYPAVPATVVYVPAPAATYRHAGTEVVGRDIFEPELSRKTGRPVLVNGPTFPVPGIYAHSQRICEGIRAATLRNGAGFADARPMLRAAGSRQPAHGPRDWKHLNEAGYRLLGALVVRHLDDQPADACDDSWPQGL
jgi:GDSL-like Lipase/Acylhydrolase family